MKLIIFFFFSLSVPKSNCEAKETTFWLPPCIFKPSPSTSRQQEIPAQLFEGVKFRISGNINWEFSRSPSFIPPAPFRSAPVGGWNTILWHLKPSSSRRVTYDVLLTVNTDKVVKFCPYDIISTANVKKVMRRYRVSIKKVCGERLDLEPRGFFRWVHPSLYEGVSVRRSVGPSVRRSVGP